MIKIPLSRFSRLLHPYPTFLLTCVGEGGAVNVITVAWLIPVSVDPPLLAVAIRPERYSYSLLVASGEFVVNVISYERAREALFCGRRSGRDVDKVAALGLETTPGQVVGALLLTGIGDAFLECRVRQQIEVGDHDLFIAEVAAASARPGFLQDGLRDPAVSPPLLHVGSNRFATLGPETVEPPLDEE